MQHLPDDPSLLPAPWWVPEGGLHGFDLELRRELQSGHPLHGVEATAVARCEACDDVLFRVANAPFAWAVVHLTWAGREEPPPWPMTSPLTGLADLLGQKFGHGCDDDAAPPTESRS